LFGIDVSLDPETSKAIRLKHGDIVDLKAWKLHLTPNLPLRRYRLSQYGLCKDLSKTTSLLIRLSSWHASMNRF